ncbi:pilus assembly protein [Litoreibacter sp.]|nr:pilus assembly protein [Litoreibacter sp.]
MLNLVKYFALAEDGAVTVDWVILSAGVISLALAAVGVITDGVESISGETEQHMKSNLIKTSFDGDDSV